MLGNFENKSWFPVGDLQGVQDRREIVIKLDVHNGTDYGDHPTLGSTLRLRSCDGRRRVGLGCVEG
jgi:hypothetical protein